MARLICTLRADTSGMQPLYDMCSSLAEAVATAAFDEPLPLDSARGDLSFNGMVIARMTTGAAVNGVVPLNAQPTIHLPLFAAEVCRLVPGVKVTWRGAWPHFSAPDDNPDFEFAPTLPRGELV